MASQVAMASKKIMASSVRYAQVGCGLLSGYGPEALIYGLKQLWPLSSYDP